MADKEEKKVGEEEEKVEKVELDECDCEDCEEDDDIFELVDDEGNVVSFYPVASFEYQNVEYMVFEPVENSEDFSQGEAVIFQVEHDGEEIIYNAIETEEKLNEVFQEFLRLQDEEFGEDDECDCEECEGHCHGEECDGEKKKDGGCDCGCKH